MLLPFAHVLLSLAFAWVHAERDGYQPARIEVEVSRYDQPNLVVRMRKQLVAPNPTGDLTTAHQLAIPQKARAAFEKGVAKADSHGDYKGAVLDFQRAIIFIPTITKPTRRWALLTCA